MFLLHTARRLSAVGLLAFVLPVQAADFQTCIPQWQELARAKNLPARVVHQVIPGLELIPRVLELDGKQPEFTTTFGAYLERRVTDARIQRGQELLVEHAALLKKLTTQYGIPGTVLLSFWGLETNFGGYMGNMPTLNALATLACDERRSEYFTAELMVALGLIQKHGLSPANMQGSWAGAMGHTQFMPSNYARYGLDGDGDGRINLWESIPDALTSAANFLQQLGWESEQRWGREVRLPTGFDYSHTGFSNAKPLVDWQIRGVRNAQGGPLPIADFDAAVVVPAGHTGPAFLAYKNFKVIMRWNRSEAYALSVGLLADRIGGAAPLVQAPPSDLPSISRARMQALQQALNDAGFDAGKPDGILGSGTRTAISQYQITHKMIADGYPSLAVFEALKVAEPATH